MRWYKRNDDLSKDARVERRGEALWPMRARAAWPYLGSIRDVRADGAARAASRVSENKVTSLAALGTRRSQSRTVFLRPHRCCRFFPRVHPRSVTPHHLVGTSGLVTTRST